MATPQQLVAEHHKRLLDLEARAARGVGDAWDRLGGPGEGDETLFIHAATPIVEGARRAAATLMAGYLTAYLTAALRRTYAIGVDAADIAASVRGGVKIDTVYARPIITMRTALARGADFLEASNAARARAVSAAQTDVLLASRAAGVDGMSKTDRVVGYRRVLTGNSCELCAVASTQRYSSDQLMPIHNHCDCGIAPIVGNNDPGQVINHGLLSDIKAAHNDDSSRFTVAEDGTIVRPTDDGHQAVDIETHDHGELGPVLTPAGEHFTGPEDIAA